MMKEENKDQQKTMAREVYEEYFSLPVWAFCHDVERIVRPWSLNDFVRYDDL